MATDLADAIAAHPFFQKQGGVAPAPAGAPEVAAPAVPQAIQPMPDASFAEPGKAMKPIPLAYPIVFPPGASGRLYATVYLRKLTVAQIRIAQANYRLAKQADPTAEPDFQIVVDEQGAPVPRDMLDLLEADDAEMLDEALFDFLPRRFRQATASPGSA